MGRSQMTAYYHLFVCGVFQEDLDLPGEVTLKRRQTVDSASYLPAAMSRLIDATEIFEDFHTCVCQLFEFLDCYSCVRFGSHGNGATI